MATGMLIAVDPFTDTNSTGKPVLKWKIRARVVTWRR